MKWVFEGKEVLVCEKSKLSRDEIHEIERRGGRTMMFEDITDENSVSCNGTIRPKPTSGCGSTSGCGWTASSRRPVSRSCGSGC